MSVAERSDTYGIHHWRILWSSYRKLAWVGFEPATCEPRSDGLTNWAMRPWVKLAPTPNFLQPPQFHCLFSVTFHFGRLPLSVATFIESKFCVGNHMSVAEWSDTYGVYLWRILWSSFSKLSWAGFEPASTEPRSDALTNWAIKPWFQLSLRANFVQPIQFHRLFNPTFHFGRLPSSVAIFI